MTPPRLRRRWGSRSGQALVEFALVVPFLLLLVVGLVEFARAWNTQQVLTDAAREALRNSVVANPGFTYEALLGQIEQALVRASLDPENAQVSVEGWKTGTGSPARIRIEYLYDFGFLGPLIGWATDDRSLALSTSFVMRNE
ncbi:MAG: pilus assembly protein [Gemmatimonadota bacterium]|nr:pilus assembly protein [Gemmatimonadota bacterium]MDH3424165.1 pilus assembly protein [Gemmatimonadota bacterium]